MKCMSEYIICKGNRTSDFGMGISVVDLDDFLLEMSLKVWTDCYDIWTIEMSGESIDYYLTKAQEDIARNIRFQETIFYKIITNLLSKDVKVAMWYDTYCEGLPLCGSITEVLKRCYDGMIDPSGMCEVYFKM